MIFQQTTTLLATVFVAGITTLSSRADTLGNLSYTGNGTSITITDCLDNTSGAVVVPSLINGKPVTEIGAGAFQGCTKITSVTLPATVTSLGTYSFFDCTSLASINLPEGVTFLGNNSFYHCGKLKSITIPSTVTSSDGAFYRSGLEKATIANGTVTIPGSLFWGCFYLADVTIPGSVTTIGDKAFESCDALREFRIPKAVTSIGNSAFAGCGFRSVSLGKQVTNIGEGAFAGNDRLEEIQLPGNLKAIPKGLLYHCSSLRSVRIPDSVTSIGEKAFSWSGLFSVTIPPGVKNIGERAFHNCWSLNSASFSGKAPTLGSDVFGQAEDEFTIFLEDGAKGFTRPRWRGYATSIPRSEILVRSSSTTSDFPNGSRVSFSSALAGSAGSSRTFTIYNVGIRPLTELKVAIKGEDASQFTMKKLGITSLAPGKSAEIKVRFKPQIAGKHKASVVINSNDRSENPFIIDVKGSGLKKN